MAYKKEKEKGGRYIKRKHEKKIIQEMNTDRIKSLASEPF